MFELSVKNDKGEVLNLSGSDNYTVYKITGLNPPKATINSSVNATADGSAINSVRLENRNIVIYTTINGQVETNRINLYKYFPPKKTVTLYFSNGTRDVYIEGTVELIECDLFSNREIAQISLICPKPYFKAVDYLVTSFSDISSLFEFPFAIDQYGIEISSITNNIRKSIINTGDVETGAVIQLFAIGTVTNPVLYRAGDNKRMKLNITMQASDTIIINTNVGEKSITLIRNGVSSNALGYMTPDSDWFVLEAGDNVFTYDADSGNGNLQITFTTSLLYGGV